MSYPSFSESTLFEPLPTKTNSHVSTPIVQKIPGKNFGIKQWAAMVAPLFLILLVVFIFRILPQADREGVENPDQGGQIPGAVGANAGKVDGPFSPKDLLDRHAKSVALVKRVTETSEVVGSGFLFKAGYLMTTSDVAGEDRGLLLSVTFPDGNGDERGPHQARIHHLDQCLAILRLDCSQGPIPLSSIGMLKANEELVMLASPGFSEPKNPSPVEATHVTYVSTNQKKDLEYHRLGGKTKPAKAGAPVLDAKGTIVGMLASPIQANDPLCITSKQILKILKDVNLP